MSKKVTANSELNADNLKKLLWQNIHSVKTKRIGVKEANSICANARTILDVAKTEITLAKMSGQTLKQKFISAK